MARKKQDPGEEPTVPATARSAYDAIVALTDGFCREHLDGEYEALFVGSWPGPWPANDPHPCSPASRRPGPAGSSARSAE